MRRFAGALGLFLALSQSVPGADRPAESDKLVHQHEAVQQAELRLRFRLPEGMTWPAGALPEVYPEKLRDKAQLTWQPTNPRNGQPDPYSAGIRSIGPGQFAVRLSSPGQPFYVALFAPGFLRFFERGPFQMADIKNGTLEIAIEKPGLLEVYLDAGNSNPERLPFDRQSVSVMRMKTRNTYLWAAYRMNLSLGAPFQIADLAPGEYRVQVITHPKAGVSSVAGTAEHPVKPGGFHENRQLALVAGQTRRIDFHYVPPDLQAFRGRRAAVVRITKPDGNPASGVKVAIGYFDGHYGTIPVYVGPVPDSGEILLKEITDRVPDNLWDFRGYAVRVGQDERLIGTFEFETRSALETFTFRLPPDVGDLAPDIDLVNVATGQRTRLSSLRGKLVCLDFWITWCEYCQEPMRKLDQAAADNRWKDRVKIVPLSFDEKCETVGPFLLERGWTHVEHFWAGPWKLYPLDTSAARAFVCNVIPVTFLIGPDGRILWRGHPLAKVSGMDIVDRIQETLKADRIAGKPTKPSGPSTVPKQAGETSARADQKSAAKKNL